MTRTTLLLSTAAILALASASATAATPPTPPSAATVPVNAAAPPGPTGAVAPATGTPAAEERDHATSGHADAPDASGQAAAAPVEEGPNPDMVLNPAQPEFTVVNLPTTLRLPAHRFAFRVSHRFTRDLTEGGFDDLLADFFGFDNGAQIGLELRYGIMRGWQAGIYRTADRTIELFTQYNVVRAGAFNLDALATLEGTNNLNKDDATQPTGEGVRSPALGAVGSWVIGKIASVNATFAWVNNTNPLPSELTDHNDTYVLGIGGRVRVRPSVYLVAEATPRIGGDTPNSTLVGFGIEKRVGGHAFQVNFSTGTGSTLAQVARGGSSGRWHIGFNINRKFF